MGNAGHRSWNMGDAPNSITNGARAVRESHGHGPKKLNQAGSQGRSTACFHVPIGDRLFNSMEPRMGKLRLQGSNNMSKVI